MTMTTTTIERQYASVATIRARVFARYALGPSDVTAIAREVAALRVVAYQDRLRELARTVGVPGPVRLTDDAILRRLARESRDVALGIVRTHNSDLRRFVRAQDRGQSQRALAGTVREHLAERSRWKTRDIALTESMSGRNAAATDVLRENGARVRVRAEPQTSAEPICAGIVDHGWYELRDAPGLPAHVGCVHAWAYSEQFQAIANARDRLWLGQAYKRGDGGRWVEA